MKPNRICAPIFSKLFQPIWVGKPKPCQPGTVETIVSKLKNKDDFILLISPEGDCEKRNWKSGYFHMARQLQADIGVIGVDFESHSIRFPVIAKPNWQSSDKLQLEYPEKDAPAKEQHSKNLQQDLQTVLQTEMGTILPLNPKKSFIPTRQPTQKGYPTVWTPEMIVLTVVIVLIILFLIMMLVRKNQKKSKDEK